ncbi:MAG TPA: alpha/beta fold hydrolase [Thermoleophilaceae bacterium]|nr:alpha/beta fold hydrolase [Thermoleophilaceae bacterium]
MSKERNGPSVIFVPGFMQPAEAWADVAERLPQRYPSLLLRHSEHEREGRIAEIAAAAEAVDGEVVLCGYSLGGRLALNAAVRRPDLYAAVVVLGAAAGIDEPAARQARREADEKLAAWMETQPIEKIVEVWERQPLFGDQSERLIEAQRPGRLSQDPRSLAVLLRTAGQGAMEPIWGRLHTLDLPILALAGSRDERYRRATRRIAAEAPQGYAAVIEHAGHAAHLQRPGEFADALLAFLDERVRSVEPVD